MHILQAGMIAIALVAFAAAAGADTVYMKSGDRASGELIELDGDTLHFDPDFADEIEIDLEDIESIETTRPVLIEFDDGREVTGYIFRDADGKMWARETPPPAKDGHEPPIAGEPSGARLDLDTVYHMEEARTYYRYEASFELGLNAASGNTDTKNLTVSWDLRPSFGDNHVTVKGQVNRAESDGDTTASNWRLENKYERDLTREWFLAGLLNFDHDKLQDLNLRTTVGAGPGYNFFEPHPTLLKVLVVAGVRRRELRGRRQAVCWSAVGTGLRAGSVHRGSPALPQPQVDRGTERESRDRADGHRPQVRPDRRFRPSARGSGRLEQ